MQDDAIRRTPLYEEHLGAQAKMIPFAGHEMPVQYPTGIVAEHKAVRNTAGLFDVSHMGGIEIRGGDVLGLVQLVTTNDASRLEVGQAQYSIMCQEDGCALDDLLVFRFPEHYLLVVNALNRERDYDWIRKYAPRFGAEVVDRSDDLAILALQGPRAARILALLTGVDLDRLTYYHFTTGRVADRSAVVSRTGYTGEDGFELYVAASDAAAIWRRLLEAGQGEGLRLAGLGARDSLRLEMGYPLYGNDLDDQHTPLEAGLDWAVKLGKGEFLGREALRRQKEEGVRQRLVGFVLDERGFPRQGYEVRAGGEPVGTVTSGTVSPSLDRGLGLAYVSSELASPGTALEIVIRDRALPATVTPPPFYKGGSIRR